MARRIEILLILAGAALAPAQDHSYTQADIEAGGQSYRMNCVGCHGGEGASVSGIDLGRGKFKAAQNDDDLTRVILNGVPGTAMPPTAIPPVRARMIVAYLRTMGSTRDRRSIAAAGGDAARGKALFENKGGCRGCHRVQGVGGRSGPDLTSVGHLLRAIEIEAALLDPNASYPQGTRPVRLVRKSGVALSGLLLNQDTYGVQILDQEGALRRVDRSELREVTAAPSWMPSYGGKLDAQELADLIAYLAAQRGPQ